VTLAKDVEPVKIGVLMDIISSGSGNEESGSMKDLLDPLRMIFNDAVESGRLDRPIEKVRASLRVLTPSLTEQMVRKNPQLTQPQRDQLMQAAIEAEQEAARRMVERLVPAFAESFSEAELKDIVVFYESPAGKALTAKTPAFAGQINMAFRAYAPQMLADINTRFCAKIGCRLKPAALTSPPSSARPSPP
jgi:hypothetical protein